MSGCRATAAFPLMAFSAERTLGRAAANGAREGTLVEQARSGEAEAAIDPDPEVRRELETLGYTVE